MRWPGKKEKQKIVEEKPKTVIDQVGQYCPENNGLCAGKFCGKWVVLTENMKDEKTGEPYTKETGRCAYAWDVHIQVEMRMAIDRLANELRQKSA